MRFSALSLVLAFLVIILLSPVASADAIPVGGTLEWQLLPITLFDYVANLGIVVAAFWFIKRTINIALMKKLAIIVLSVTLVGAAIWAVCLGGQGYGMFFTLLPLFILVGVAEVFTLAFLLRWHKLSTLGQGILIGATMVVVGFFVGLPVTLQLL